MLAKISKISLPYGHKGAVGILLLLSAFFIGGCNFVDPGEKTTVPFGSNELRLPIYQNGDFLLYDVNGTITIGSSLGTSFRGTLRIDYGVASDNVIPTNLNPTLDPTKVLKETISLNIGQVISSERYVYQNQNSADPLYGAMYLIAVSNRNSSNKKFSWPGQSDLLAPQLIMKPVVFANVSSGGTLDPINFEMYVDCDSTGVIDSSCANQWLTYSESSQLTNVGDNNYGYFYHEKTYLTATITKTQWDVSFQNQSYIDSAKTEGFSAANLDTHLFCSNVPATGAHGIGSGQYFYLNQVGVVTMSALNCFYTADSSGISQQIQINLAELYDARVAGVNLNDIL